MAPRLRSHRQKHTQKQLLILIGSALFVIIFVGVFGLRFLLNIGSWISNAFSDNTEVAKAQDDFFGTIFVDTLPTATNSADIYVSGSTTNFERVEFLINDKQVADTNVLNQDVFVEKVSGLIPGENTVVVRAVDKSGKNRKESATYTIRYINTKPDLSITEPSNESKSNTKEITIRGKTDADNSIEIDGFPVVVNANGSFSEEIRLKEGENVIVITAIDQASNTTTQSLSVTYEKEE